MDFIQKELTIKIYTKKSHRDFLISNFHLNENNFYVIIQEVLIQII